MLQSNNILFLDTLAMAPPPGESGGGGAQGGCARVAHRAGQEARAAAQALAAMLEGFP